MTLLATVVFPGCSLYEGRGDNAAAPVEEEPAAEGPAQDEIAPEEDIDLQAIWEERLASWPIDFGFADEEGRRLILVTYDIEEVVEVVNTPPPPDIEEGYVDQQELTDEGEVFKPENEGFDPDVFSLAIGAYGDINPIRFHTWQNENQRNNGRENYNNFGNLPGYIYAQKDWTLSRNKTYLLTEMGVLVDSMLALFPPGWSGNTPSMEEETIDSIEKYKERGVVWGKVLATTMAGAGLIGVVLYEREGNDMLFSIVYMDDEKTLFWDRPAVYNEEYTWRAGAGDEPGSFSPLALARFDEGMMLIFTWSASQGEIPVVLYELDGVFVQAEEFSRERVT